MLCKPSNCVHLGRSLKLFGPLQAHGACWPPVPLNHQFYVRGSCWFVCMDGAQRRQGIIAYTSGFPTYFFNIERTFSLHRVCRHPKERTLPPSKDAPFPPVLVCVYGWCSARRARVSSHTYLGSQRSFIMLSALSAFIACVDTPRSERCPPPRMPLFRPVRVGRLVLGLCVWMVLSASRQGIIAYTSGFPT